MNFELTSNVVNQVKKWIADKPLFPKNEWISAEEGQIYVRYFNFKNRSQCDLANFAIDSDFQKQGVATEVIAQVCNLPLDTVRIELIQNKSWAEKLKKMKMPNRVTKITFDGGGTPNVDFILKRQNPDNDFEQEEASSTMRQELLAFVKEVQEDFYNNQQEILNYVRAQLPEVLVSRVDLCGTYALNSQRAPTEQSDVDLAIYYSGGMDEQAVADRLYNSINGIGGTYDIVPFRSKSNPTENLDDFDSPVDKLSAFQDDEIPWFDPKCGCARSPDVPKTIPCPQHGIEDLNAFFTDIDDRIEFTASTNYTNQQNRKLSISAGPSQMSDPTALLLDTNEYSSMEVGFWVLKDDLKNHLYPLPMPGLENYYDPELKIHPYVPLHIIKWIMKNYIFYGSFCAYDPDPPPPDLNALLRHNPDSSIRDLERNWRNSHEFEDFLIYQRACLRHGQQPTAKIQDAAGMWLDKQMSSLNWWSTRHDSGFINSTWTYYKVRGPTYPENVRVGVLEMRHSVIRYQGPWAGVPFDPENPPPAFLSSTVEPIEVLSIQFKLDNYDADHLNPLRVQDITLFLDSLDKLQQMIPVQIVGRLGYEFYKVGKTNYSGHWLRVQVHFWKANNQSYFWIGKSGTGRIPAPDESAFEQQFDNVDKKPKAAVENLVSSLLQLGYLRSEEPPPATERVWGL